MTRREKGEPPATHSSRPQGPEGRRQIRNADRLSALQGLWSTVHTAPDMPRRKPTPEELQLGAAQILDTLTTALRQLEQLHDELVEAGRLVGLDWPRIAQATGKTNEAARKDAARKARKRGRRGDYPR